MIEYFYVKGWYLLYPSLGQQRAFSTNHYEEGVHSINPDQLDSAGPNVPDDLRADKGWQDSRFTTPLVMLGEEIKELFDEFNNHLHQVPLVDCYHRLIASGGDSAILVKRGQEFLHGVNLSI
jgi:hypothetical protein